MNFRFCYRAEVAPELVPVLPVNRKYRSFYRKFCPRGFSLLVLGKLFWVGRKYRLLGRYYRSCGFSSLKRAVGGRFTWAGTTGPAGFCAQRPDFPGHLFNGLSSPTVLRILVNLLLSLSSIVAHLESLIPLHPSDDSCPNLGIQERRSRSTIPPNHSSST